MKIIKQDLFIHIYTHNNRIMCWHKSEYLHREDGPAEEWNDGAEYYHLNNLQYHKDSYWKEVHENY